MDSELVIKFLNKLNTLDDRDYLIAIIKFHASPTLVGIKPSSLINFTNDRRNSYHLWNVYKNEFSSLLKIDYTEIYGDSKSRLVFFYNPHSLMKIIKNTDTLKYLQKFGYKNITSITDALKVLENRFIRAFPHEIGIFLGIPQEDVEGFIINSGVNFKINGYWKVYSDIQRAVDIFQQYDNSRILAIQHIMEDLEYKCKDS